MEIDYTMYYGRKNIVLSPTKEQEEKLFKFIDLYRFVYNWGIERENEIQSEYQNGLSKSSWYGYYDLARMFGEYRQMAGNEWLLELPSGTARQSLKTVERSYKMFFKGYNKHPHYKSRFNSCLWFKVRKERTHIDNGYLKFEGMSAIKCNTHEFDGIHGEPRKNKSKYEGFCEPIIKFNGDKFVFSFMLTRDVMPLSTEKTEAIGIDFGVRQTIVCSDGSKYQLPDTSKYQKQIARCHRKMQKRYRERRAEAERLGIDVKELPKSNRLKKVEAKCRKAYRKESNIKETFGHTAIKDIVMKNPECIVIETFKVKDARKEGTWACKQLAKVPFYKYAKMTQDKCETYGVPILKADSNFPSSQICSNCGWRNEKIGGNKVFKCKCCGVELDRDLNASLNLKSLYK